MYSENGPHEAQLLRPRFMSLVLAAPSFCTALFAGPCAAHLYLAKLSSSRNVSLDAGEEIRYRRLHCAAGKHLAEAYRDGVQ